MNFFEQLLAPITSEKLEKKGVLISNLDTKRKTGDLTVKNVRLAVSEEDAESKLGTLSAKQRSVLSLLVDIGSASVKEVCYLIKIMRYFYCVIVNYIKYIVQWGEFLAVLRCG